jgi:hypothetical protein
VYAVGELTFEGISLTPLSRVIPGEVLILQASVSNSGDSSSEATIVVSLDELPKLQSSRRVYLAAGRREQVDVLVPIPETAQDLKTLHITATMVERQGEREVILQRNGTLARHSLTVEVGLERKLALATEAEPLQLPVWFWPPEPPATDYQLAIAARLAAGHDRMAATFDERPLPLIDSVWAGLDLFVVSDPGLLDDAAVVELLRRYVVSGGRLWIMLDKVPCELVRPLLSQHQLCEEIERVELNDFVVDSSGPLVRLAEQDRRVVSDVDIPMARVLQEGGDVRFEVEGWPAAIEMNVGYGQIVLTTLDSRAWIEPRTTQVSQDSLFQSDYQPRAWAKYFAIDANEARSTLPLTERVDYPLRHIGNPIVPRSWVGATLLLFFSCLAGVGLWLASSGRLPRIGIIAPVAAVLVSVTLIAAATWMRRDIPESLSRFQVVEVGSDGNSATIREQAAVYLASVASMKLAGLHGGTVRTSEAITSGVRRFAQEDFQSWKIVNDAWPPGIWRYEAAYCLPADALVVRGTLSKTGLQLDLPDNLPSRFEDPILSFTLGNPMLCEPSGDGLAANNSVTVTGDRWIAGSFLSDEQQRRLELYRQFFLADKRLQPPSRRLYGWTGLWEGASWDHELTQLGSALTALPVHLERPTSGTEILVPHGLIKLQRDLTSSNLTTAFDDRTGRWQEDFSTGTQAELQFVLPTEVVPIAASAIELELDITAPQRDVTLSVKTQSGSVNLVKLDSPSIPWRATITDPVVLEAAKGGVLNVLIDVSESRNLDSQGIASNIVHWQIAHFHASLRGTVLAKSSLSDGTP